MEAPTDNSDTPEASGRYNVDRLNQITDGTLRKMQTNGAPTLAPTKPDTQLFYYLGGVAILGIVAILFTK